MIDGPSLGSIEGYSEESPVELIVGAVEVDGRSLGDNEGYSECLFEG